jgi:prefoldin subunit 5
MAFQLQSQMQLRSTGQPALQSAAKDLDDLMTTINIMQTTVASMQQAITAIQAQITAGATVSAVVGNAANTGSSTLAFTNGILKSFTP